MPRDRLSPLDASFLYLDGEVTCNQAVGLSLARGPIDFERVVDEMQRKVRYFDRLRQCAVFAPFNLFRPTWRFDPAFDIRNHVKQIVIEPASSEARTDEALSRIFGTKLDRRHPLWAVYVINGAPGGRDALVIVLHHCVTDGIGFAKLATAFYDTDRAIKLEPWQSARERNLPSPLARLLHGSVETALFAPDELARTFRATLSLGGQYVSSKGRTARAMLRAFHRAPGVRFPFNAPLTGEASFSFARISFYDLVRIRKSHEGTTNDVLLATVGTTLQRYAAKHGINVEGTFLRVLVPSNVRTTDTLNARGNFVSVAPVLVPLDTMTTAERLKYVIAYTRRMKDCGLAQTVSHEIALVQRLLPAPLSKWAHGRYSSVAEQQKEATSGKLPKFNIVVTNVPGVPGTNYIAGRELEDTYVLVPLLASIGLCCGAFSNTNNLCVSFSGDRATVPDIEILAVYLEEAFNELIA